MFLFSRKTKTLISTYSDSYRAPTSIKEVYKDPPLWAWKANKFVTPTMHCHMDPEALQKMVKYAAEDYTYKRSISGHPYLPEKYLMLSDISTPMMKMIKCCTSYLGSDQYNTWRTGPYNSYWNKRSKCVAQLQLQTDAGMETVMRGMPLEYGPKPERLNAYGMPCPMITGRKCNMQLQLSCHCTTHFPTLDGTHVTSRRLVVPRETTM
uniref:Spermatid-specific manchette-related protein 1 n=1 Tax=Nannospalax galili TaxID=1026970 RepID=A0A8C6W7E3_NANGA